MRRALASVVALIAACSATRQPQPSTFIAYRAGGRYVLGAPITVYADWSARCTSWSGVVSNVGAKSDSNPASESKSCNGKASELTLQCSTKCTQIRARSDIITVVPHEIGPLTISTKNRRTDTGEVDQQTLDTVLVVQPTRLELRCATGSSKSNTAPCGPEGVPASNPMLETGVYASDQMDASGLLQANGTLVPLDATREDQRQSFSLLLLYPDAREGSGIKPGTYPVTLTLGAVTSTWQVVAR